MKSILDPSFHYIPSAQTDLKKTFARIRREQARAAKAEADAKAAKPARVVALSKVKP